MRLGREGEPARLITRGGYDRARRYPGIVEAVRKNRQSRFAIGGEVIFRGVDGVADFNVLQRRARHRDGRHSTGSTLRAQFLYLSSLAISRADSAGIP